jgi:hypothetical protein
MGSYVQFKLACSIFTKFDEQTEKEAWKMSSVALNKINFIVSQIWLKIRISEQLLVNVPVSN